MKWLLSITISLVFSFNLIFSTNATESDITSVQPSMPGLWQPGRYYLTYQDFEGKQVQLSMPDPGHHTMPHPPWDDWFDSGHGHHSGNFKIADLDDENPGPEIVLLRDETLIIMDNLGNVLIKKEVEDIEDHHEGWWFMPGHDHNGGEVGLEVADLDDDGTLEIIILDAEKLIVLDNNGDPKSTIPLPEVDAE